MNIVPDQRHYYYITERKYAQQQQHHAECHEPTPFARHMGITETAARLG